MARVFIAQETNHNFETAEKFGEVVFLTVDRRDDFNNNKNSEANEHMLAHLARQLRDFDGEVDWLMYTGSPYIWGAMMWILGHKTVRRVQILRWDNQDATYRPLYLNLRQEAPCR